MKKTEKAKTAASIKRTAEYNESLIETVKRTEQLAITKQSNNFVRLASYSLSRTQLRIWLACLREIPSSATELPVFHFKLKELCALCGVEPNGGAAQWMMYDALQDMTNVRVDFTYRNKDGTTGITSGNPFFSHVYFDETPQKHSTQEDFSDLADKSIILSDEAREYDSKPSSSGYVHNGETLLNKQYVSIVISPLLKNELLNLAEKGNYTTLSLFYVLPMVSKYSIRIYQILRSYAYLAKTSSSGYYHHYMSLDSMKAIFSDKKENATFSRWANIKKYVLLRSMEEINKYTDIIVNAGDEDFSNTTRRKVTFEEASSFPGLNEYGVFVVGHMAKKGRSVIGVFFDIKEQSYETKLEHLNSALADGSGSHQAAIALAKSMVSEGTPPVIDAEVVCDDVKEAEISKTVEIEEKDNKSTKNDKELTENGSYVSLFNANRSSRVALFDAIKERISDDFFNSLDADSDSDMFNEIIEHMSSLCMENKTGKTTENDSLVEKVDKILRSDQYTKCWFTFEIKKYSNDSFWKKANGNISNPIAYVKACVAKDIVGYMSIVRAMQAIGFGNKLNDDLFNQDWDSIF